MSSEAEANLLVVLLDLHPVWWADHSLPDMIQGALVLANAHLLQGPLNKVIKIILAWIVTTVPFDFFQSVLIVYCEIINVYALKF